MNSGIRHIVLNTLQASAADLIVKNQWAYIDSEPLGRVMDLEGGATRKELAVTSATPAVWTYTPPAGALLNSQNYGLRVTQWFPGAEGVEQKYITRDLVITTPATGTITATSIANQFRNEIFTSTSPFDITASGTTTLILTASSTNPIVVVSWLNFGAGASTDLGETTTGIATRGTPAAMQALGVSSDDTTGTAYTLYSFAGDPPTGKSNSMRVNQYEVVYLWINQSATNYAAFITRMDEFVQSFPSGGSTYSDPEILAVS